jgi:hypothetical protein
MSAFCPLRLTNKSHYRVVMNSLPGEGGVTDQFTNSIELGRYLQHAIFNFYLHHEKLFIGPVKDSTIKNSKA